MKVQIETKELTVYVSANDITTDLDCIDQWIKALQTARAWLKRELEKKA